MKGNIAIIAALSGELRPLVTHSTAKSWRRLSSPNGTNIWEYRHRGGCWLAACAGMGAARAALALSEVEKILPLDAVCSVGWAGALDRRFGAGSVCNVSLVVDVRTGERFRPAHIVPSWPILVTTTDVAGAAEKRRLAESYGAGLVDMEAASIARLSLAKGLPFYCYKAISDDVDASLPDINPFISNRGQLRMPSFMLHVALRPASWGGLAKLGKHSAASAKNLAECLYDWLDERAYIRKENGDFR